MRAGLSRSAAVRDGSRMISISRTSPPRTSTRPTPGTREMAGRTTSSARSRNRRGSRAPLTLNVTTGNDVVVRRSTTTSTPAGSVARVSPTRDSVSWSARHMSVPDENRSESSTAPRIVRERTRCTPSTVASAVSSGRPSATWVSSRRRVAAARDDDDARGNSTSG